MSPFGDGRGDLEVIVLKICKMVFSLALGGEWLPSTHRQQEANEECWVLLAQDAGPL